MITLEKVQSQIAKLQAQAEAIIAKQSSGVIEKIRELMEKHGLTTADIDAHTGGKRRGRKPGVKVVAKVAGLDAKYRDPKTGATWSGRGRAPAWIASAKDRTRFLIDSAGLGAAKATSTGKKAGNYLRGPQPAKYRDPATGATWSGRGPAPVWLASAKDRNAFLIVGATEGSTATKQAAKKAPSKKVAAKKAVGKKTAVAKKGGRKGAIQSVSRKAASKKAVAKRAKAEPQQVTAQSSASDATTAAAAA